MHKEVQTLIDNVKEERDLVEPLRSNDPIISTAAEIIGAISDNKDKDLQPITVDSIATGMSCGLDSDDINALMKKGFELKDSWPR